MAKLIRQDFRTIGLLFFIGALIITSSIMGYGLGRLIDHKFNSAPWGIICMLGLCTGAGFIEAYQIGRRYFKN